MAVAASPGLWDWTLDPALAPILALAMLHRLGSRRTVTPARTRTAERARTACLYAALAVLAVALCSPIDAYSERLFWVHMVQHVLLLMVAAPLLVLARPWIRMWRALGLSWRRSVGRGIGHGERAAPLRAAVALLGSPMPSLVIFSGVLLLWHVPALFDATLHSDAVHALEHTSFLGAAVLLWKHVIASQPLRAPLSAPDRALYTVAAMVVSWVLAVVLALAPHPLYAHYAHELARPGGVSALADQQLAAGVMWVPGSIPFVIVVFAYIHRWLAPPAGGSGRAARLAAGR